MPQVWMTCTAVRGLLLADRPEVVAQTSHDHTHVLFNRGCGGHWKLLQNPAQIASLAPPLAGASVLRLGRSYLRDHSFTLGLSDTTACDCSSPHESVTHYLLDCPLYAGERLTLFGQFAHLITQFQTFTKKCKVDILLHGFQPNNPDYYHINISLQYHVQNFVLKTIRFLPQ